MDDRRFDRLARALATAGSRRQTLLGAVAIGATALAGARRSEAQAPTPAAGVPVAAVGTTLCAGDGQPCVMLTGCCSGFTCVTSAINPNQGFCQSGGSGGVVIAPPLMAGDTSGSTQPAPTSTPRPRKTHTPGDNKGTTSTNTSNHPAYRVAVRLNCSSGDGNPETTWIRNSGTEPVEIPAFDLSPDGSAKSLEKSDFTMSPTLRLKPGKSVTVYSGYGQGNDPTGVDKKYLWSPDKKLTPGAEVVVNYNYGAGFGYSSTTTKTCPGSPSNPAINNASTRKKHRKRGKGQK